MPQGDAAADAPDRGPISVRGWKCFGPGFHKGQNYSPADCAQIAANYARLRGVLTPKVKLGHDKQQLLLERLKKSLGWPNVGRVTRLEPLPDGCFRIDIEGLPRDVAAVVNAGWLDGGSIELKEAFRDPADPAKFIPGDVMTGIALLGEEQPAVQGRGMEIPTARYADGTEVPAATEMPEWLTEMMAVSREMAAEAARAPRPADAEYDRSICFSDMFQEPPVTPEQIIEALAAMSPEDKAKVAAACGAPAAPPADAAMAADGKPKGDGAAPAWFTAFADDCKKQFSDVTARVGAMEAVKTAQMSAAAEEKEKAFSAEVDRQIKARDLHLKYTPHVLKTSVRPTALGILNSKEFSSEADRTKEFSAYFDGLGAAPVSPLLKSTVQDAQPAAGPLGDRDRAVLALTPLGRSVLGTLTAAK